jgi:DNA-binding NarL/FixJ family response regulator
MQESELIRTVLLVDDHPVMAEGIRKLLSVKYRVVLATDSQKALEQVYRDQKLSLILLDRTLPDADGMLVLSALKRRYPDIPVAMLSADEHIATIRLALQLGAAGYIPKTQPPDVLCRAVDALLAGENWVPHEIRPLLDIEQSPEMKRHGLTPRQFDVLLLLHAGFDNKEIADSLGISETTVKTHVSALFKVLGARNRTMCVRTARQLGLLE